MTPLEQYPELAGKIGFSALYFKREDLHPYGSHKGRSIPPMIDHYYAAGERRFAVSSSGNAALAAAIHVAGLPDASLDVFVGNHVSESKLSRIQEVVARDPGRMRVLKKERPLQALLQATDEGFRSLRQSTDDEALRGYASLAEELERDLAEVVGKAGTGKGSKASGAIFIGTSSGTTAQALAEHFSAKKLPVQVHIVQTSSCHPMAEEFEAYDGPEETSIADAIVDQTARRKAVLVPLVSSTGGHGWIATNDDIIAAQRLVQEHAGMEISTNSALSIVGAMKAAYVGHEIDGPVVCMICGE